MSSSETHSVPLSELMPDDFVSACSKFKDLQELFDSSGFKMDTAEDFAAIPDKDWDEYIRTNTSYPSWTDMQESAAVAWTQRQLGLR